MRMPRHSRAFAPAAILGLLLAACSGGGPSPVAPSVAATTAAATVAPTPAATARPRPTLPPGLAIHPEDAAAGVPLGYVEYVPPAPTTGPRPLLVFLHGSGESGDGSFGALTHLFGAAIPNMIRYGGWPAERPFIVLMPQHEETAEAPCFTADEIEAFLLMAVKTYPVDPKRVYLTGLSCGAIGAWDYLGQHTDETVAAAVLIAGDGRHAFEVAGCSLGRVPIWALHGQYDANVEPDGSRVTIAELKACTKPKAVDVRLTIYEAATHNVWDRTYSLSAGNDVFAWLLAHVHP
jgi:predicted peptidase